MEKRVNIRVEHIRHSKCRDDFVRRVKENASKKKEAKEKGIQVNVKRLPALPREATTIPVSKQNAIETLTPLPYDTVSILQTTHVHMSVQLKINSLTVYLIY